GLDPGDLGREVLHDRRIGEIRAVVVELGPSFDAVVRRQPPQHPRALADPLQEGLQAFDPHAVSPHSVIILEICTLSASESTALGGRTERSQSPSWCMASLTTETLLALPLRARIASNSLIESCSCVTRRRSASRS